MANPTTAFGWVMPTSTSLVTNLPADFNTFGQAVDNSMQYLLGGTTGQVLSKTSGTNMAFTWVTPTDQTPLTTKGDLFAFSTVDARLAVGANETRLVADSTQTVGLKYVADTTNYAINAKADLLVGTAADTLAALTVGTNGQVLTADSTVSPTGLKWATPSSGTLPILTTTGASGDFTTTSTSYVDVTNMTITRTPVSATNKIEVKASFSIYCAANVAIDFKMFAGATGSGLAYGGARGAAGYNIFNVLFYFTNVAASSTVFKLQMKTDGGSATLYGTSAGFNNNFSVFEVY